MGKNLILVPIEPTDEMLIAGMKVAGVFAEPFEPATECGISIEQGMSQADCDVINAETMSCYRVKYKAMLAAAPAAKPEGGQREDDEQTWVAGSQVPPQPSDDGRLTMADRADWCIEDNARLRMENAALRAKLSPNSPADRAEGKPVAWMITDPDGDLSPALTFRPQDPVSKSGLVITPLYPALSSQGGEE